MADTDHFFVLQDLYLLQFLEVEARDQRLFLKLLGRALRLAGLLVGFGGSVRNGSSVGFLLLGVLDFRKLDGLGDGEWQILCGAALLLHGGFGHFAVELVFTSILGIYEICEFSVVRGLSLDPTPLLLGLG